MQRQFDDVAKNIKESLWNRQKTEGHFKFCEVSILYQLMKDQNIYEELLFVKI